MTFSLTIFLYIYYCFLAGWLFFCLIAIYHMFKFGFKNLATFTSTLIFILVAVIMLVFSLAYIDQIEWSRQVSIFSGVLDYELPIN